MRSFTSRVVGVVAVAAVLLAACGGDDDGDGGASSPAEEEPAAVDEAATDDGAEAVDGVATLEPLVASGVSGDATLTRSEDTGVLTVTLELDGVEDGAEYKGVIAENCDLPPAPIVMLGGVFGGSDGTAQGTLEVMDVDSIDLDGGWSVLVARAGAGPQACGEVGPA